MVEQLPVTQQSFGQLRDGRPARLFTLTNARGLQVSISDFGGVITQIMTPDKHGKFADIVLGFDSVEPYETVSPYFGALIGRFGNRIAKGRFSLDGKVYQLAQNDGDNHLHGGVKGFDKVLWQGEATTEQGDPVLRLHYVSADGEEGYPGRLEVDVLYRLTDDNRLITEFSAITDAPTPVNLTQHSYFNLAGGGDVLQHEMQINASQMTPVTEGLIPRGELAPTASTPFDFIHPRPIGQRIDEPDEQLQLAGGYDHNFVLDKRVKDAYETAAVVREPASGRQLTVATTEPAIQFYSGNFLDGSLSGKGRTFSFRSGFCLEPQHYPDAPNRPEFPCTIVRPGETFLSKMSFAFDTVS